MSEGEAAPLSDEIIDKAVGILYEAGGALPYDELMRKVGGVNKCSLARYFEVHNGADGFCEVRLHGARSFQEAQEDGDVLLPSQAEKLTEEEVGDIADFIRKAGGVCETEEIRSFWTKAKKPLLRDHFDLWVNESKRGAGRFRSYVAALKKGMRYPKWSGKVPVRQFERKAVGGRKDPLSEDVSANAGDEVREEGYGRGSYGRDNGKGTDGEKGYEKGSSRASEEGSVRDSYGRDSGKGTDGEKGYGKGSIKASEVAYVRGSSGRDTGNANDGEKGYGKGGSTASEEGHVRGSSGRGSGKGTTKGEKRYGKGSSRASEKGHVRGSYGRDNGNATDGEKGYGKGSSRASEKGHVRGSYGKRSRYSYGAGNSKETEAAATDYARDSSHAIDEGSGKGSGEIPKNRFDAKRGVLSSDSDSKRMRLGEYGHQFNVFKGKVDQPKAPSTIRIAGRPLSIRGSLGKRIGAAPDHQ
eukprot:TRINITY_DN15003_c1_g1_i2.p1 TRINITY_DN15003_c1_g1~~TRINITY_DN15003_c1_g1_i2.p1  ORF type:complete len:547 (+),score=129.02 TRINITY_DN15003_c1_g1_i2:236-1642(+)